jgi:hypothetical protein
VRRHLLCNLREEEGQRLLLYNLRGEEGRQLRLLMVSSSGKKSSGLQEEGLEAAAPGKRARGGGS